MTDYKVSDDTGFPPAAAALGAMQVPVNDAGTSRKVTLQQIIELDGDWLGNQSLANQSPAASTDTILTNSGLIIPAAGLRQGTVFRYVVMAQKTAAGTAGPVFKWRLGTAGTTADATILTFTFGTGTAVADNARFEMWVTMRSVGAGTAAVAVGGASMLHNLQNTGWSLLPSQVLAPVVSAGFNSTTANLIASLAMTPGASHVTTVSQVIAEAKNL